MHSFKFNKSDYHLMTMYFVISILWLTFRYNVEEYTTFETITGLIGYVLKTVILIYIITWLIRRYLVAQKSYLIFFILVFLTLGFIGFLDLLRDYFTADPSWLWNPAFDTILVNSLYNSTPDVALPLGLILGKKYYENKLDYVALKNTQKEMELKVLRSQYDPHFLYNSLNTINAIIDYSTKEKVKEYISHLASLYRYLIQTKDEDIVTLDDEIALAKNYFYLIQTRFENDYDFEIIKKQEPLANYLPNGSLLTVLENVVKHNTASGGNTIITKILIEESTVRIVNSVSKKEGKVKFMGTGLMNLKKRYHLLSDQKVIVEETVNSYTIVLPLLNLVN